MPAYGYVTYDTTGASVTSAGLYVQNPVPGAEVTFVNLSTQAIVLSLNGTTGTTGVQGVCVGNVVGGLTSAVTINLPGAGQSARLVGLSTSKWLVQAEFGSTLTTWQSSAI